MSYIRCAGAKNSDYHEADGALDQLCAACRRTMLDRELPTSWELLALQRGDHFEHFYPSTTQVQMCGDDPIFRVRLTIDIDGPYWGWRSSFHPWNDLRGGRISMIYLHRPAVEVCFAYGSKAETERGKGEIVRMKLDVVRPATHPEWIR